MSFQAGAINARRTLGTVGVDSATVVAVDARAAETYWKHVGPERIGRSRTPKHHRQIARLIERQFGLKWHAVDPLHTEFKEPISEELEARITAYLQTFPEYAEYTFIFFYVETKNTLDRIQYAMRLRLWNRIVLDDRSGVSLLAFTSGFGDGSYSVDGLYQADEIRRVEVQFIGPAQDKILKAFPMLRY